MLPESFRAIYYTEDEMSEILGVKGKPLSQAIMRRRMQTRALIPPYQKIGASFYWPKDLFKAWAWSHKKLINEGKL